MTVLSGEYKIAVSGHQSDDVAAGLAASNVATGSFCRVTGREGEWPSHILNAPSQLYSPTGFLTAARGDALSGELVWVCQRWGL